VKTIVKVEGRFNINNTPVECTECHETSGLTFTTDPDVPGPVEIDCPNGHSQTSRRIPQEFVLNAFRQGERFA
jgi:hypothetical protein